MTTYHATRNEIRTLATEKLAWLATGEHRPTNFYVGSSQIHTMIYNKVTLPAGTDIEFLHGGDFVNCDGDRVFVRFTEPTGPTFEKNYNYDFSRIDGLDESDLVSIDP